VNVVHQGICFIKISTLLHVYSLAIVNLRFAYIWSETKVERDCGSVFQIRDRATWKDLSYFEKARCEN